MGFYSVQSLMSSSFGFLDEAIVSGATIFFILYQLSQMRKLRAFSPAVLFKQLNLKSLAIVLFLIGALLMCIGSCGSAKISEVEGYYMSNTASVMPRPITLYSQVSFDRILIAETLVTTGWFCFISGLFLALALWRPASFVLLQESFDQYEVLSRPAYIAAKWYSVIRLPILIGVMVACLILQVNFVSDNFISLFTYLELAVVLAGFWSVNYRLKTILTNDLKALSRIGEASSGNRGSIAALSPSQVEYAWLYHPLLYYYLENLGYVIASLMVLLIVSLTSLVVSFGQFLIDKQAFADLLTMAQNSSVALSVVVIMMIIIIPESYRMIMGIQEEEYFFESWWWDCSVAFNNLKLEQASASNRYSVAAFSSSNAGFSAKQDARMSKITASVAYSFRDGSNGSLPGGSPTAAFDDFEFFMNATPRASSIFSNNGNGNTEKSRDRVPSDISGFSISTSMMEAYEKNEDTFAALPNTLQLDYDGHDPDYGMPTRYSEAPRY